MKLFKVLGNLFAKPVNQGNILHLYYQCNRCKHAFPLLLRKSYDVQMAYDDAADYAFVYQKELRDPKCFNDIKIEVYFDRGFNILKQEIKGGKLISREEYENLQSDAK